MAKKSQTRIIKNALKNTGLRVAKAGMKAASRSSMNPIPSVLTRDLERLVTKKINNKIKGSGIYTTGRGRYRGRGAYVDNQLFASSSDIPPRISNTGDETGTVIVSRREYITDVFSPAVPATFTNQFYSINPGLSAVFVWLSQIASNYEEYEFIQLVFEYCPVVADSSNSGAMGTIIAAGVYNAASPKFTTKQAMNEYDAAISGRICDRIRLGIECDPLKNGGASNHYIRSGSVPVGQDIKTYDVGSFQIATSGISAAAFPAGTQLGELWVSYKVVLRKPKLYDALGYSIPRDVFYGQVGLTNTLPLGTAPLKSGSNSLGGVLTKATETRYTFPDNFQGYVRVLFYAQGGSLAVGGVTRGGGVTLVNDLGSSADVNSGSIIIGTTSATMMYVQELFVPVATSANANFLIFTIGSSSSLTLVWADIIQYNPLPGPFYGSSSNFVAV